MNARILCFLIILSSALAHAGNFGLGGIVFSPTGASVNYYFDRAHSIDGALSTGLNDSDQTLYIHSTFLWHKPQLIQIGRANFDVFYGAGVRIISWDETPSRKNKDYKDETYLGPRGAVGGAYYFKRPHLQVFGELSLTIDVVPESDTDLDFAAGVRYYF